MNRMIVLALLLASTAVAYSLEQVEATQVVELDTTTDKAWGFYSVQPFYLSFEPDNGNTLTISILFYQPLGDARVVHNLLFNIETGEITRRDDVDPYRDTPLQLAAESPVIIENHRPQAEGFPIPSDWGGLIYYADLSPDHLFLATKEDRSEPTAYLVHILVFLWQMNSQDPFIVGDYDYVFRIAFTSSGHYFLGRGSDKDNYVDFTVSKDEFRATLDVTLLRLPDMKELEAHGDIAFSQDEEYFITEREGKPTLVEAETDRNLLQYDMPSQLVAAVFSPDQQQVFLTGTDNQLYVFGSHLPAAVRNWMLQ